MTAGRARGALLCAAWLLAAAGPPNPGEQLGRARAEELRLGAESVAAAGRLREADEAVAGAAQSVSDLADRRRAAERALAAQAAALAPLLPLAQRLSLYPAETLLAVPASPERAILGLGVLHGVARAVQLRAAGLRTELERLRAAERALDAEQLRLRAAQAEQAQRGAALDRQLAAARAARTGLEDAAAEQARRAAAEATRADTVAGALDVMAASRARTEAQLQQDAERADRQRREAALATARERQAQIAAVAGPGLRPGGAAVVPVAGTLVRRWGDATDAGPAHGIALAPPPKARVVAPCAGRVVFAGPFRSYGLLVIVDCGADYHFVLAGLDRLDAEVGDAVRPGEPLGSMPDWNPAEPGSRPSLYLELRRDGRPLDPAPFLHLLS